MIHTPQNTEESTLQTLLKIKEEAEKQLAIIDKAINDVLLVNPTQPELTRETGKFVPLLGAEYYSTINGLEINNFTNNLDSVDKKFIDNFHAFPSKDAAETEASYTLASRRVRAFAKAVNGDWKADWGNEGQEKWGINSLDKKNNADWSFSHNCFIHQIAFPTKELAAKALELLKPEWEILSIP
jgi:hypothetical protein